MIAEGGDPNDLNAIAAKARSLHPEAYTDGTTANRRTPRNADAQDFQYKKAKHTDPEHWANKTITMHELIEEQGWSGKIRQLDDEQFIEAVKASKYPPIYRGVYEYQGEELNRFESSVLIRGYSVGRRWSLWSRVVHEHIS